MLPDTSKGRGIWGGGRLDPDAPSVSVANTRIDLLWRDRKRRLKKDATFHLNTGNCGDTDVLRAPTLIIEFGDKDTIPYRAWVRSACTWVDADIREYDIVR